MPFFDITIQHPMSWAMRIRYENMIQGPLRFILYSNSVIALLFLLSTARDFSCKVGSSH